MQRLRKPAPKLTAPQYVYHVMNAWDAEGLIISDVMSFESAPPFSNPDGSPRAPSPARLKRWTIDLNDESNQVREALLDDTPGEFPRFDERRSGLPYLHGWIAAQREHPGSPWFDRLAHLDLERGGREIWEAPQGDAVAEPVFVPLLPAAWKRRYSAA